MADDTQKPAGRWMRPLLVVSLALNLAVAGLVIGGALSDHKGGERGGGRGGDRPEAALRGLGPMPFIAALSEADRQALMAAVTTRAGEIAPTRETMRRHFEEMLGVLRAEPFDAAAMAGVLAELRQAGASRLEIGEALMVERFNQMTPAERAAYADRLDKSLHRGPSKR